MALYCLSTLFWAALVFPHRSRIDDESQNGIERIGCNDIVGKPDVEKGFATVYPFVYRLG